MDHFVPPVFDGDLLFFPAGRRVRRTDEHSPEEWRPLVTGGIDEVPVDCGHNEMIEPDVAGRDRSGARGVPLLALTALCAS